MQVNSMILVQPEQLTKLVQQAVQEAVQPVILQLNTLSTGDEFLSRKEAYKFLRVGSTKFNQMRRDGLVKSVKIGMTTLYKKSELLKLGTGDKGVILPLQNQDSLITKTNVA